MLEKYHGNDPMIDVISEDYRMLQLISRFGIKLGFGDQSVAQTCQKAGVDTETFLAVVNYIKAGTHVHVGELAQHIKLPSLVQYLRNSHAFFLDYRMPEMRRKLLNALDMTTNSQIAMLVLKFYDECAMEVSQHMQYENEYVYPHIDLLSQNKLPQESFYSVVRNHKGNHSSLERSIQELKDIIIKYYPNDANSNLLNDVLMEVYMTEEDFLSHCQLEDTLLTECVQALENEVRERGGEPVEVEEIEEEQSDSLSGLSEREREVIRMVAMGLSNKEIADKMFISVNTVMTHRRNINRKTGIHAAAGLTIYAIVNGLIRVEEVKL